MIDAADAHRHSRSHGRYAHVVPPTFTVGNHGNGVLGEQRDEVLQGLGRVDRDDSFRDERAVLHGVGGKRLAVEPQGGKIALANDPFNFAPEL